MNKALDENDFAGGRSSARKRDWRKAMSDNVALALLVYTALQIFVTVHAMKQGSSSIMPYLALVVLVAGILTLQGARSLAGRVPSNWALRRLGANGLRESGRA